MINTLVLNVPPLDISRAPISGAILCAVCKQNNHNVTARNLQIELNDWLTQNHLPLNFFDKAFYSYSLSFSDSDLEIIQRFINNICQSIQIQNYDYVLISVFSFLGQGFTKLFVKELRKYTNAKIVVGGAGLTVDNCNNSLAESLKNDGHINCYITGEAENGLNSYFLYGFGPGVNNTNYQQIDNLDQCPWPDYSFYNLDDYSSNSGKELLILGSRGCVRKCTFCDVEKISPKFRYRSGKNIADEIIHNYEKFGVTTYYFTDSLVNGSLKAFDDLCNALQNYKFDNPVKWKGQYIIRNRKSTPKNHFELLKSSGCEELFIGIETGSDRVRHAIGKKFTNDDIEYYLENFKEFGINALFLFFTGYVDETLEDHNETLNMFKRWQQYVASGTITGIETLNILAVLPGAPLYKIAKESNFHFIANSDGAPNDLFWLNPKNPSLDFKERVRRHLEMMQTAIEYKWPIWNGEKSLDLFYEVMLEYKQLSKNKFIHISEIK